MNDPQPLTEEFLNKYKDFSGLDWDGSNLNLFVAYSNEYNYQPGYNGTYRNFDIASFRMIDDFLFYNDLLSLIIFFKENKIQNYSFGELPFNVRER